MAEVTLIAETGRETGSPSSRRLRAEGKIPATVYGMGQDPVSVTITRADFRKAMTTDAGTNALIKLEVDGKATEFTLVKDLQRHTVRRDISHVDLIRIDPHEPMVLDVPIVLTGEAKKVYSAEGVLDQVLHVLQITVRPDAIPTEFRLSVSEMDIDDVLTVGDIDLPAGCSTDLEDDDPIVIAQLTRAALVPEDEEGEAGEGDGDGEEGEGDGDSSDGDSAESE